MFHFPAVSGDLSHPSGANGAAARAGSHPVDVNDDRVPTLGEEEKTRPPSPALSVGSNDSKSSKNRSRKLRDLSKNFLQNIKTAGKNLLKKDDDNRSSASYSALSSDNNTEQNDISPPSGALDEDESAHAQRSNHPNDLPDQCVLVGYQVKAGDTINGVAMRHGMTVGQFRQLNKMFGEAALFTGQVVLVLDTKHPTSTAAAKAAAAKAAMEIKSPLDAHSGPPTLVRRHSKLGGEIYEPVVLVDKKIHIGGSLEVNSYYVMFNALRVVDAAASEEVRSSEASMRLVKCYQFRLDIRDIQGCSASELHHENPEPLGLTNNEEPTTTPSVISNVPHPYRVRIFWKQPDAGYSNPLPLTLYVDDLDTCSSIVAEIQTQLQKQQGKSARLASLKISESESITGGSVVSGLLFKRDHVGASREHSPADLVQQALLNGEVTEEEARILHTKSREVEERMAALAEAQRIEEEESLASQSQLGGGYVEVAAPPNAPKLAMIDTNVLPHFSGPVSKIVEDEHELIDINRELPDRLRNHTWVVTYSTDRHGVSLKQFYRFLQGHNETLILCETRTGERFGCFATEQWTPTRPREFYGTGESFVFSFRPDLKVYKWTGANDFIMSSSASHIGMGGGGGFVFCLDEDLDCGTTSKCETFGNLEPLLAETEFRISQMEVITFEHRHSNFVGDHHTETRSLFSRNSSS